MRNQRSIQILHFAMELIILCYFDVNCSQRTRCTEYCVRDAQEPKPLAEKGNILAPRNLDRQAPQALRVFRWLLAAVPPRSPPSPGSSLFWNSQGQRLCAPGPALQNTPSCLASASTTSTDTFNSSNSQRPPVPGYGVPQVQRRPHFRPFSASCDIMSAEGGNNRDCTASQPPSPVPVTNPVVPTPGRISIDMTLPEPSLLVLHLWATNRFHNSTGRSSRGQTSSRLACCVSRPSCAAEDNSTLYSLRRVQ